MSMTFSTDTDIKTVLKHWYDVDMGCVSPVREAAAQLETKSLQEFATVTIKANSTIQQSCNLVQSLFHESEQLS